jgi:predicted alternative tryptophan synthase beta-subunit
MPLAENPAYNQSRIQAGSQLTPGASLFLGVSLTYGAALTASVHPVTDEIDVIYIAQCSGAVLITTATAAGQNANALVPAGNLLTKQSAHQVNSATIAATAGLDLRIQRIAMIVPNLEGANAIVEVSINKSAQGQATAGS